MTLTVQTIKGGAGIGVDPGQAQGAAAFVHSDIGGNPEVLRVIGWQRDKRKRAVNAYRVKVWQRGECTEVSGGAASVFDAYGDHLLDWVSEYLINNDPAFVWKRTAAVEAILSYGPPRKGLLDLAANAGGLEALSCAFADDGVQRPPERVWTKAIADVPGNTRKAQTRVMLRAALDGKPCTLRKGGDLVSWGIVLDGDTLTEHMIDAVGIALYGLGGRLVRETRRET